MLCRKPFVQGMAAYPCGQCMPCRVNRRRVWTHRLMLENLKAGGSSFVTLTYRDDCMPVLKNGLIVTGDISTGLPCLRALDLVNWVKRLRRKISPRRIRYYAVGEYGDESWRPHYHVALYGWGPCLYGRSQYSSRRVNCCPVCDLVRDTWGNGIVYLGELETKSAAYIAGYMMKRMTRPGDERLQGRTPEFARMSLRPGIGASAVLEVAQKLLDYDLDEKLVDPPGYLDHGRKRLPLGRYLHGRLREMLGRSKSAPVEVINEIQAELLPLWNYACEIAETPQAIESVFANLLTKEDDQRVLQMTARQKLLRKGKPL